MKIPAFNPLSSVMRLEPYRYFEFDDDLQQYTNTFMEVQCEATAFLSTITAQVAQGTRLHLVDSGSSVFTSPHKDTSILPIKTTLKLSGVGGVNSDLMSPLIYTVLDANGAYIVLHYQVVYYLPSVTVALFATGQFEQQGWTFHLHSQASYMTKGDGTCVPFQGSGRGVSLVSGTDTCESDYYGTQGVGQTAGKATKYGRSGHGVHTSFGFLRTTHLNAWDRAQTQ